MSVAVARSGGHLECGGGSAIECGQHTTFGTACQPSWVLQESHHGAAAILGVAVEHARRKMR